MLEPIISIENGRIYAYITKHIEPLREINKNHKVNKIFYQMNAKSGQYEELVKEAEEILIQNTLDKEKIVFAIREPKSQEEKTNVSNWITYMKSYGYEVAYIWDDIEIPDFDFAEEKSPSYVILEEECILKLENDTNRLNRITSLVIFGQEMHFSVIALGVHTESVLLAVMEAQIPYVQGDLFHNAGTDCEINNLDMIEQIKEQIGNKYKNMSLIRHVGDICEKGVVMDPDAGATEAYDWFERNDECTSICVVDQNERFVGLLTKTDLMHAFGGRYGYSLHKKNHVIELSKKETLVVGKNFSIENVSKLAMKRSVAELYDPIIVLDQKRYFGVVTVKELLSATISIEVERANELNPLTALPGNKIIEERIHRLIGKNNFFAIMYIDLDNFKAFNDAYGFPNGDRMIETVANAMHKVFGATSFLGHVGGDDFVIITDRLDVKEGAEQIIAEFNRDIRELYNNEDWERGYIVAKSRKGMIEEFPIASLSIAIITNQINKYNRMMELTEQIVTAKKKAKDADGNSIVVL